MWRKVEEHPLRDEYANPPQVLLWSRECGHALGLVHRWADGQIITTSPGFHGFTFTHYKELDSPK